MPPYDAAWKLLFSYPELVRDLLAGFLPREWVAELDLATLERWPESRVSNGLRQRHQDRVWRVRFRDRRRWLLVLLEFQSATDRTMAVRILAYSALLYQDLLRVAPSEPLPSVLPLVLYHGAGRWAAPAEVAGLCAAPGEHFSPCQPAQRYVVLDLGGYTGPLPAGRNLVAMLVRLVQSRGPQEEAAAFDTLAQWLSGPEDEGLMRAFWTWMGNAHIPEWRRGMQWPALVKWNEAGTMLNETLNAWTARWLEEGRVEGKAEGRAEGRSEGQAEVVCRMAARKFDVETADRLAGRLAGIADPERVGEVGEWLIECEDGDELLERVAGLCGTPVAAGDPSPR